MMLAENPELSAVGRNVARLKLVDVMILAEQAFFPEPQLSLKLQLASLMVRDFCNPRAEFCECHLTSHPFRPKVFAASNPERSRVTFLN